MVSTLHGVGAEEADLRRLFGVRCVAGLRRAGELATHSLSYDLFLESPPRHLPSKMWLSAGGPSASASFVAQLPQEGVNFTYWQWSAADQLRLGTRLPGPCGRTCQNAKTAVELCSAPLSAQCDHAADRPSHLPP